MGLEIEKKFLIKDDSWKNQLTTGVYYRQGYISSHPDRVVRIRTIENMAYLTIKGKTMGAVRSEYEYEIPYEEAIEMLTQLCEKPLIEKIRYKLMYNNLLWEIDEFEAENKGLVVAEVELEDEFQPIDLPPWIGEEVTMQPKYYNASLIKNPFSSW
ncbi:CYTH domain-containing protein [Rhodocytophaga aerolata]|uniref:CYTH domain-containing protein n=1 Tax=Rhodocytophaga aerolata TaxID=455078 RepID=A0ABT8QZI9_9BACT|nr:CYTH domain-containing protein [Rhodocytophaga aerolata]MDO1445260.1 CYTH domain-containing protein [Rhodocytophaga aerolata]